MKYEDLTNEQKNDIARYDNFMRSILKALGKVGKEADSVVMNQFALLNVDPVISSLDQGELIPNSTGYAGAKPLTKTEFLTLQGILRGLETTKLNHMEVMVKAIGVDSGGSSNGNRP